jgi:hypothetical protein
MRSPVARGVRRVVRSTQSMVSQIVVSVVAAVSVAFITNAYLGDDSERVSPAATPAAIVETAAPATGVQAAALPPLQVEIVADAPNVAVPGQEIFPGVPAGVPFDALQQTVSTEKKKERRRFLGIPLPFTTADSTSSADEAIESVTSGS